MEDRQIAVFKLNNQLCGVDTSQIKEIVAYKDVYKEDSVPEFVEGFINIRDKKAAVVDLNRRFELGETQITNKTKIITVEQQDITLGFAVDDVVEIINMPVENIESSSNLVDDSKKRYVEGVAKKDGREIITIINLGRVLLEQEIERLKK